MDNFVKISGGDPKTQNSSSMLIYWIMVLVLVFVVLPTIMITWMIYGKMRGVDDLEQLGSSKTTSMRWMLIAICFLSAIALAAEIMWFVQVRKEKPRNARMPVVVMALMTAYVIITIILCAVLSVYVKTSLSVSRTLSLIIAGLTSLVAVVFVSLFMADAFLQDVRKTNFGTQKLGDVIVL